MKKIVVLASLLMILGIPGVFGFDWTKCKEQSFVVTAYYSPLKDQAFYYKKTFEEEVRLNGQGIRGASGRKVFNGMLAAPSSYQFGSVVYLPDYGVGQIEDRGGAIVASGGDFKHDRIDIWMGKGEEGLVRALTFGKKTLKGYYCDNETLNINNKKKTIKVGMDFDKVPVFEHFFDIALWVQELWAGRQDIWTFTLQNYLVKLGYLSSEKQDGYFGDITKKALCKYQTDNKISSVKYSDCGVFGQRTRASMKKKVEAKKLLPQNLWEIGDIETIKNQAKKLDVGQEIIKNKDDLENYFDKAFKQNDFDPKVPKLQELLTWLGYYSGKIDGVYNQDVKKAVHLFQLDKGILKGYEETPSVWGYMGPATRKALNNQIIERERQKKVEKMTEIFSEKGNKIDIKKNDNKLDNKKQDNKEINNGFQFYRSYKKSEGPNEEIRILQQFLQKQGFYKSEINGIYGQKTIDALSDFQIKNGILKKDSDVTVRGYLGPKTRDFINNML